MRRFVIGALLLCSCGGSPQPSTRAPAHESVTTTTAPTGSSAVDGDGIGDKKKESPEKQLDLPGAQSAFDDAAKAFAAAGSDCASMCKALQSMIRATTRICELAESAEAIRCSDAKTKLENARARVKATCGGTCE